MKTKRGKRKKKGWQSWKRGLLLIVLLFLGCGGFLLYDMLTKPYTIALDAGHGGKDVGAEGVIQEIALTEHTVAELQALLKEDGRFRVVLSRKAGEGLSITERNEKFRKRKPDLMLSIHGNASDESEAYGFEVYPTPPGRDNHEESLFFAQQIAKEMESVGARLRGTDGVRFGYYKENGQKLLVDSEDTQVYDYPTFGMLDDMECPAILIEQCFVTNAADVEAFGTEEGCRKAAAAYYRAICRYLEALEQKEAEA